MVHICYLCGKRQITGQLEPMHRFPKKQHLRSLWIEACGLLENDNVSNLTLCCQHFRPADYVPFVAKNCRLRLKPGVVPSVGVPKKIPLLNWNDQFEGSINDPGIIEEIVETSYDNLDSDNENVPLSPNNCKLIESQNLYESEQYDNNIGMDIMNERTEISTVHEEHAYSTPFRDGCNTENFHHAPTPTLQCIIETNSVNPDRESTSPRRRKFVEPRFVSEIELYDFDNPKVGKRTLNLIKTVHETQKTKIRSLRSKVIYLQKRIAQLKQIALREKQEKSTRADENLLNALPDNIKDILIKKMKTGRYPDELKEFALTLNSYSPKAYNYVRKFWRNLLPYRGTLREWHREKHKTVEMKQKQLDAVIEDVIKSDNMDDVVADVEDEIIISYEEFHFEDL